MAEATFNLGRGTRSVEDAISYAVGDRTRIEILAILNEGARTREELAQRIGLEPDKLKHHLRELLADGSIELARAERIGNILRHSYRAVRVPFYTEEEVSAMPEKARHAIIGVTLQAIMAEALAAFWAGKMVNDPSVWLAWRWFNVDAEGRKAIADEQDRSWARVQEIEVESAERCVESGEQTTSIVVTSLGYIRSRTAPALSASVSGKRPAFAQTSTRLGQGGRQIEEAVSYAVGHRIRIEILALLNEGVRTPEELARLIGQAPSKVRHHIKELLDDGSIELARAELVRNTVRHSYRAVRVPFYTEEEVSAMPEKARHAIIGVTLQAIMAEALAAFWAGKMVNDPSVWLAWRWFNVDAEGRKAIADEQDRSWARVQEIEVESAERCVESGEQTTSIVVTSLGYIRSRTSATPPATDPRSEKPIVSEARPEA